MHLFHQYVHHRLVLLQNTCVFPQENLCSGHCSVSGKTTHYMPSYLCYLETKKKKRQPMVKGGEGSEQNASTSTATASSQCNFLKIKCHRMHLKVAWNKLHIEFFNHCGKGKLHDQNFLVDTWKPAGIRK